MSVMVCLKNNRITKIVARQPIFLGLVAKRPGKWVSGLLFPGPFTLALGALSLFLFAPLAWSQEGTPPKYVGVSECRSCHGGGAVEYPNLVNSFQIWVSQDEHSKAYEHLSNDLGVHIAGWMGLPLEPGSEKTWSKCVRCHMVEVEEEERLPTFDPTTEGIGCEGCHGAAEDYLVPHKSQSYEANLKVGLADLKDLRARARRCLDCHVGLDHEIVAAGHPDLNFEFLHFSFWQPPHWNYREASTLDFWAIGQAAAFERTLEHLVADSKLYRPIPEFEEESCYNCHHKLDRDRWRQVQAHATVVYPLLENLLGEERANRFKESLAGVREVAISQLPNEGERHATLEKSAKSLTAGLVDDVSGALSSKGATADLILSLLGDLTEPLVKEETGLKPNLPIAWMVQNFNDAEQVYYAFRALIYSVPGAESSGPSTETLTEQVYSEPGGKKFEEGLDKLYEFLKYRKIESRREAFRTQGFNEGLEALKNEVDR